MLTLHLDRAPRQKLSEAGEVFACCYAPDNQLALSGGWDGQLRIWDPLSDKEPLPLRVGGKPVTACAVFPDGKQWLVGNLDGLLSCWDADTHRELWRFLAHPRPISAIVFGNDGRLMATASWDCKLALWTQNGGGDRAGRTLGGHKDIVAGCRFTRDSQKLLSWSYDYTLRLWDISRACHLLTLSGHTDRVLAAAISPDGSWAISGSRDGMFKLWDLVGGTEKVSFNLENEIRGCFFLLDGKSVVTVESSGRVQLYSFPEMQLDFELNTDLPVQCADLAHSGGQIALGCGDGRVHFVTLKGFDTAPLAVTVIKAARRTASKFQKMFGKSQLIDVYLWTCPACRQQFEHASALPAETISCHNCQRQLRSIGTIPGELPT